MSNYRCLQTLKSNTALSVAALFLFASPVLAQQLPAPELPASSPVQTTMPQAPAPLALPAANSQPQQKSVEDQVDIKLPEGATISDADQKVRSLAAQNAKSLDALAGSAADMTRTNNDVDTMAKRKIKLMELDSQIDMAKRAKELWKILNGDDTTKQNQIKDLEAQVSKLKSENEKLTKKVESDSAAIQAQLPDPDPVVASISGAAGDNHAEILVPYMGKYNARVGSILPNGQKVVSISASGVTVSKDGATKILSFGTAVPSVRPNNKPMYPASVTVMPQN